MALCLGRDSLGSLLSLRCFASRRGSLLLLDARLFIRWATCEFAVELGQDEVGHQEIAVMFQSCGLYVTLACELGELIVKAGHHFAKEEWRLLRKYVIGSLSDELEEA